MTTARDKASCEDLSGSDIVLFWRLA